MNGGLKLLDMTVYTVCMYIYIYTVYTYIQKVCSVPQQLCLDEAQLGKHIRRNDGAEICELIGLFILHSLKESFGNDGGLQCIP